MFSRSRSSKFNQKEKYYKCDDCTYGTTKKSNFLRHLSSSIHMSLEIETRFNTASVDQQPQVCDIQDDYKKSESSIPDDDFLFNSTRGEPDTDFDNFFSSDFTSESDDITGRGSLEAEDCTATGTDTHSHTDQTESEWFPFLSKVHFLLSVLYSSKTHRVSDETMMFIIFILKECGTKNVPSLAKIKNYLQEKMDMGEMLQRHEDTDGDICWTIKPTAMLRLQLANPDTAKRISRYPTVEMSSETIDQASGEKWKSMEFHWAKNREGQQFIKGAFISFIFRGQTVYGKIIQFLENLKEDRIYVKVHRVLSDVNVNDNVFVKMNKQHTVALDECHMFDVSDISSLMEYLNGKLSYLSNEIKEETMKCSTLWRGLPVVSVPLNLFMDDLSANQSRRWAPLHAVQGQISGLPLDEKNKGKSVMFLGLAEKMAMIDLLSPICRDIETCKQFGVETYDASLKQMVVLTTDISLIVTDYQMMSLACNHLGPSANKFCPKCFADESDPFKKWDLRTKEGTLRTMARIKLHSDKTLIQRQTGVKDYDNCLWNYLDAHKDTPVGLLHFLYLGLAKQLIKFSLDILNEHQKNLLTIHLDSIDQTGFSYKIQSSFFKYVDSRQGKDYKHYLQIAVFNMEYAGLSKKYISVIEKLAMISKHVIRKCPATQIQQELEEYLKMVKDNIPELGRKRKTHLCVHLADDMERHGHPLHYAEDSFEKNHKAIRSSIAHQNGHARSRDTAIQFLNNELMAHVTSGGFMPDSKKWKCAAKNVLVFGQNKKIKDFLGMSGSENEQHTAKLKNMVRIPAENSDDFLSTNEVQILQAILICGGSPGLLGSTNLKVTEYSSCATTHQESAKVDSFVLYHMVEDDTVKIGQIYKLFEISWKGNSHQVVLLRKVRLVETTQERFQHITTEAVIDVVKATNVLNLVHVVHDCKGGRCCVKRGSVMNKVEQERHNVKCSFIKHSSHNIFIINKCRITHSVDKFVF